MKSLVYILGTLVLFQQIKCTYQLRLKNKADSNSTDDVSYKYDPNLNEDYSNVDEAIQDAYQYLYDVVALGYGTLKTESEEELKRGVTWIEDFYDNITKLYEDALYNFEQTYAQNSNKTGGGKDYEFVFDIEAFVYSALDDFDEECKDQEQEMEDSYWAVKRDLGTQQEEIENIVRKAEQLTDDTMDITDTTVNFYIERLNNEKWDIEDESQKTSDDVDEDLVSYYEDDEDNMEVAEMSATSALINEISNLQDFDSFSSSDTENESQISSLLQKRIKIP